VKKQKSGWSGMKRRRALPESEMVNRLSPPRGGHIPDARKLPARLQMPAPPIREGKTMPTLKDAHAAIGTVVTNGQFLEVAFVMCVKLAYAQNDAQNVADVDPLNSKTFKTPTAALLKELRNHINVAPKFDELLSDAVDRRHRLIHRWLLEKGLPQSDGEATAIEEIIGFSTALSADLNALTRILLKAIHAWLHKFPETDGDLKQLSTDWLSKLPPMYQGVTIEDER
jgi:hypothetical protein